MLAVVGQRSGTRERLPLCPPGAAEFECRASRRSNALLLLSIACTVAVAIKRQSRSSSSVCDMLRAARRLPPPPPPPHLLNIPPPQRAAACFLPLLRSSRSASPLPPSMAPAKTAAGALQRGAALRWVHVTMRGIHTRAERWAGAGQEIRSQLRFSRLVVTRHGIACILAFFMLLLCFLSLLPFLFLKKKP